MLVCEELWWMNHSAAAWLLFCNYCPHQFHHLDATLRKRKIMKKTNDDCHRLCGIVDWE